MTKIISTDFPLTDDQRIRLGVLLDTLIPASGDGRMPSAAEVDFESYLQDQGADLLSSLPSILGRLDERFAELALEARGDQVHAFSTNHPEEFSYLLHHVYDCYYQDDRVRTGIGVVTGPLFPQGNSLPAGDLSLLDPVIEGSERHGYRRT